MATDDRKLGDPSLTLGPGPGELTRQAVISSCQFYLLKLLISDILLATILTLASLPLTCANAIVFLTNLQGNCLSYFPKIQSAYVPYLLKACLGLLLASSR